MAYFMNKIRKTNGNSSGKQANCLKRGKTRVITSHVVSKESPIQILIFHKNKLPRLPREVQKINMADILKRDQEDRYHKLNL